MFIMLDIPCYFFVLLTLCYVNIPALMSLVSQFFQVPTRSLDNQKLKKGEDEH